MQRVHRHAVHRGPRRLRQPAPPLIMPTIANADPVHRTKHHRLAFAHHNDAPRTQRIGDRSRLHIRHRHSDLRRRICVEHGDAERFGGLKVGEEQGETQNAHGSQTLPMLPLVHAAFTPDSSQSRDAA